MERAILESMTAQISDIIDYRERPFNLAGVNGDGLFDPSEHGVKVRMIDTSCWRGYYCRYDVSDGFLRLKQVYVGLNDDDRIRVESGQGPLLFGRTPSRYIVHGHSWSEEDGDQYSWESNDFRYDQLHELIPFSGGLLLGDGFMWEMYVHMGFHPAYKFREVHELIFEDGQVVSATDRSKEIAGFRDAIAERPLQPTDPNHAQEIEDWIDRTFSQNYKW